MNKTIWVFGSHDRIAEKYALRFLADREANQQVLLRQSVGLELDTPVIPVFPNIRERMGVITDLQDTAFDTDVIIMVVAKHSDLEDPEVRKLSGQHAVLIHPDERRFYIETNLVAPGTYRKYTESIEELEDQIRKCFEKSLFDEE